MAEVYHIAGTVNAHIGGKAWSPCDPTGVMTPSEEPNIWIAQMNDIPPGYYEFKVTQGGAWHISFGHEGVLNGSNMSIDVSVKSIVQFFFNDITHVTLTKTFDSTNAPPRVTPSTPVPPRIKLIPHTPNAQEKRTLFSPSKTKETKGTQETEHTVSEIQEADKDDQLVHSTPVALSKTNARMGTPGASSSPTPAEQLRQKQRIAATSTPLSQANSTPMTNPPSSVGTPKVGTPLPATSTPPNSPNPEHVQQPQVVAKDVTDRKPTPGTRKQVRAARAARIAANIDNISDTQENGNSTSIGVSTPTIIQGFPQDANESIVDASNTSIGSVGAVGTPQLLQMRQNSRTIIAGNQFQSPANMHLNESTDSSKIMTSTPMTNTTMLSVGSQNSADFDMSWESFGLTPTPPRSTQKDVQNADISTFSATQAASPNVSLGIREGSVDDLPNNDENEVFMSRQNADAFRKAAKTKTANDSTIVQKQPLGEANRVVKGQTTPRKDSCCFGAIKSVLRPLNSAWGL
eukprot:m.6336 g.6336  ORF g.6336 m.6336 type:complete len:517 (-) comp5972_c0_seq1:33-1583(-)